MNPCSRDPLQYFRKLEGGQTWHPHYLALVGEKLELVQGSKCSDTQTADSIILIWRSQAASRGRPRLRTMQW